jgi:hypothetical protein
MERRFRQPAVQPPPSTTLWFNGICGTNTQYLIAPRTLEELAHTIRQDVTAQPLRGAFAPSAAGLLFGSRFAKARSVRFGGPIEGVDAKKIEQSGWGIILPARPGPDTVEALRALMPLIEFRRRQTQKRGMGSFVLCAQDKGYQPGESIEQFYERFGVEMGAANPRQLPYYLLIVGSPAEIPFDFQRALGRQRAVGRLHLDHPAAYAHYAATVIRAERGELPDRRTVALFATDHDPATQLSRQSLVGPLLAGSDHWLPKGFDLSYALGPEATREHLLSYLGSGQTPAVLFTAAHGLVFPFGNPHQAQDQGGLVCPGPLQGGAPVPSQSKVTTGDISPDADVAGLVYFAFGCYSAGTPHLAEVYPPYTQRDVPAFAAQPFVAPLARRLLGHPRGTALAVIGHVDRTWGYSFSQAAGGGVGTFQSILHALIGGTPVGEALRYMREHFGELGSVIADRTILGSGHEATLVGYQTTFWDTYNYILLGDPAVRLPSRS